MSDETPISIELTKSEALVLFEYLRRCDDEGSYSFADQSEQRALWELELRLLKWLPEVFSPEYGTLLNVARDEVRDPD